VAWRGTAAAADNVQPTRFCKAANNFCHLLCTLVVFAKGIRQSSIGVYANGAVTQVRQFINVGTQLLRAKGAI